MKEEKMKGGEYHGSKEKSSKEKSCAKKEGSKEKEEIAFNRKTNNPAYERRDYLFLS